VPVPPMPGACLAVVETEIVLGALKALLIRFPAEGAGRDSRRLGLRID